MGKTKNVLIENDGFRIGTQEKLKIEEFCNSLYQSQRTLQAGEIFLSLAL